MPRKRKPKPIDPATGKPFPTRQDRWRLKMLAEGRCIVCGQLKEDSPYKNWCRRHGALSRLKYKKKRPDITTGLPPWDVPVKTREDVDRLFPAVPRAPRKKAAPETETH